MKLEFYKKGQGVYIRVCTALGIGLLLALGCLALRETLGGISTEGSLTPNAKAWIQAGLPAALFIIGGWLTFKLVNKPSFTDFLIQTEGEMKKVSWSSTKEIVGSTKVVIFTVLTMAVFLAVIDMGFSLFFKAIGVLHIS